MEVRPQRRASHGKLSSNIAAISSGTLQQQARSILQRTLDTYHIGLEIADVSFQKVAPPTQVKDAFDDVNAAREDKQGSENHAHAYASKIIPQARGDAARILAEAAAYKAARVAHAEGDARQFKLLLAQYRAAPEVTRRRLWLETLEHVLAHESKIIDGSGGRNIINLSVPGDVSGVTYHHPAAVVALPADPVNKEKQP